MWAPSSEHPVAAAGLVQYLIAHRRLIEVAPVHQRQRRRTVVLHRHQQQLRDLGIQHQMLVSRKLYTRCSRFSSSGATFEVPTAVGFRERYGRHPACRQARQPLFALGIGAAGQQTLHGKLCADERCSQQLPAHRFNQRYGRGQPQSAAAVRLRDGHAGPAERDHLLPHRVAEATLVKQQLPHLRDG